MTIYEIIDHKQKHHMSYKGKHHSLTVKYSDVTKDILKNQLPSYCQVSAEVPTVSYRLEKCNTQTDRAAEEALIKDRYRRLNK